MSQSRAERIELLDETRRYPRVESLKVGLAELMEELGLGDRELTVVLLGDAAMAEFNMADRGEDGPTDVLSYPTREPEDVGFPELAHLGDILVGVETAARQAEEHGHTLHQELLVLMAHGLTHLRGFDHQDDEGWRPFLEAQRRVLELADGGGDGSARDLEDE